MRNLAVVNLQDKDRLANEARICNKHAKTLVCLLNADQDYKQASRVFCYTIKKQLFPGP